MAERDPSDTPRVRREPPPLREVAVVSREELTPRMTRVTFEARSGARSEGQIEGQSEGQIEGLSLDDLAIEPAASVRLLIPTPGSAGLVMPHWNGNEYLLPDGERPVLRTFTPRRVHDESGRLDLEIVRHPGGAVSQWSETVAAGDVAAIAGPGRGYQIDESATDFVLLGDETAIPAISQLIEMLPATATVSAHVEVTTADAQMPMPDHPHLELAWHVSEGTVGEGPHPSPGSRLVDVARTITSIDTATRVWAAGEAASMQAIRKHLFGVAGLSRRHATIRGYWKLRDSQDGA